MHGVGALVLGHKREESELAEAFGIVRRAGLRASRINLAGINVRNACAPGEKHR
jgi:hypothetical protein